MLKGARLGRRWLVAFVDLKVVHHLPDPRHGLRNVSEPPRFVFRSRAPKRDNTVVGYHVDLVRMRNDSSHAGANPLHQDPVFRPRAAPKLGPGLTSCPGQMMPTVAGGLDYPFADLRSQTSGLRGESDAARGPMFPIQEVNCSHSSGSDAASQHPLVSIRACHMDLLTRPFSVALSFRVWP